MAHVWKDRVFEAITDGGTGDLNLDGAIAGFQGVSAIGDGNEFFYSLWDVDSTGNPTGDWEDGIGQYTSSGDLFKRLGVFASSDVASGSVPVIASKGAVASGTALTSLATNAPSGVTSGDTLLLFLGADSTNATILIDGWRLVGSAAASGSSSSIYAYRRNANGTATDTPTISFASALTAVAVIYRITGARYASMFEVVATGATANVADFTVAAFTVSTNNTLQIVAATGNAAAMTETWPGPLTMETDHDTNKSLDIASAERDAGSISAQVVTVTGTPRKSWINITILPALYDRVNFASGAKRVAGSFPYEKIRLPIIQPYTTADTFAWVKPPGCTIVEVILIGGGGGGGSGRKGATNAARTGGSGGGAGGVVRGFFLASELGDVETVVVGPGGAGGPSQATNTTDGSAGTAGTASTFGSRLRAAGGGGGAAGTAANVTGSSGGSTDTLHSLQGGTAGGCTATTGVGAAGASNTAMRPTGGGGGCGLTNANAAGTAGAGGALTASVNVTTIAGGIAGTAGGVGGNGNSLIFLRGLLLGTGGGGGHASTTGNSGAGGDGGLYGAGGGGGAASSNSVGNSGAGGIGARGAAVIISW